MPRMQTAAGDQTLWIMPGVIGDELVDLAGKSDHLWRNIVDKRGTIDTTAIEIFQEGFG